MIGGCMSLELKEAWATDKNEGIVTMQMLFKAMRLDNLSKGLSVNVENKVQKCSNFAKSQNRKGARKRK